MRILLTAASAIELNGINSNKHELSKLVCGVGMTATAFSLAKHLAKNSYDLVLNVGMAGSFLPNIKLGEVVRVGQDTFSELGVEDNEEFIPWEQLNIEGATMQNTFRDKVLIRNSIEDLRVVNGITVNRVHGNAESIVAVRKEWSNSAEVESMEGAAFFYTCQQFECDEYIQIRAISNYVTVRNKEDWELELALSNLSLTVNSILEKLEE